MPESIAVIVVAAGAGRRFGQGGHDFEESAPKEVKEALPKQFQRLLGRRILSWALEAFADFEEVGPIVCVLPEAGFDGLRDLMDSELECDIEWVAGGASRQASVRNGLDFLGRLLSLTGSQLVAVHDGARPLIDAGTMDRVFGAARQYGAAIPTLPVVDTLKSIDGESLVVQTHDRRSFVRAQTPQCFRADRLVQAFEMADRDEFIGTDEASLVERTGARIATVLGSETNLKITSSSDLALVEWYLSRRLKTMEEP